MPPSASFLHMALIFLSYRVATAASHVDRLYDRLTAHFGEDAVFFDRGSIGPGDLWRERIQEELHRAVAVVAIIDPQWLDSFAARADGDDVLRFELETAIQLQKKIVPLRVGGAGIPSFERLPPTLRALLDRQFVVLDATTTSAYSASLATVIAALENTDALLKAVETKVVDLLVSKNYVAAERLLIRQPETARQQPNLSVYLALARLAGRSFNALYPAERETIEMLLRRARATASSWELPMLLLAIMQIDYYRLHGLAIEDPVATGHFQNLDGQSRSLVSNLNVSRRARRELRLDTLLGAPQ